VLGLHPTEETVYDGIPIVVVAGEGLVGSDVSLGVGGVSGGGHAASGLLKLEGGLGLQLQGLALGFGLPHTETALGLVLLVALLLGELHQGLDALLLVHGRCSGHFCVQGGLGSESGEVGGRR